MQLYLILLLLMLESYEVKTSLVCEELDMQAQEVKTLAKELGCDLSGDKVQLMRRKKDAAASTTLEDKLPRSNIKRPRTR